MCLRGSQTVRNWKLWLTILFIATIGNLCGQIPTPKYLDLNLKTIFVANQDEQIISLKHSDQTSLLYLSTTKGRVIALDNKDSTVEILDFKMLGQIYLDQSTTLAAFSCDNNSRTNYCKVFFFDQRSFEVLDTLSIRSTNPEGAFSVWFSKNGIFISSFKNLYCYRNGKLELMAGGYSILDYDIQSDKMLLGFWNESLSYDRKIKKLSICLASSIEDKTDITSVDHSNELYSRLLNNGNTIISMDGQNNYYFYDLRDKKRRIEISDPVDQMFGLAKLDDTTIVRIRRTQSSQRATIILTNVKSNQTFFYGMGVEGINDNQVLLRKGTNRIYYVTPAWGNKLVSFEL